MSLLPFGLFLASHPQCPRTMRLFSAVFTWRTHSWAHSQMSFVGFISFSPIYIDDLRYNFRTLVRCPASQWITSGNVYLTTQERHICGVAEPLCVVSTHEHLCKFPTRIAHSGLPASIYSGSPVSSNFSLPLYSSHTHAQTHSHHVLETLAPQVHVEIERGNALMERRPGCPSMGARAISWTVSRDGTIRACIRVLTSLS